MNRKTPLAQEQFDALKRLDASTLANAIETFHDRLRNEGFADATIRCLLPELKPMPMLGYAATVKIRGSAPPTADGLYPELLDWLEYVLSVPPPRVVVVQDVSSRVGLGSLIGSVHMNILRALQCVGVATNGSVRDIPAAAKAGFHYFAASVSVSHAYVHVTEFGGPVTLGRLKIESGDLLHGDRHGIQSVPLTIADKIPAVAAKIVAKEQALIALCRSSDFSLANLRAALAKENAAP